MNVKPKLEYAWQGPGRGVARVTDRAVLLAHGAGADMHAPTLTTVTDALSAAGIPSLRFRYPYRSAGKKAPDRPAVLLEATRTAIAELARRTKLPPERLVLGGRSMGGRYCSMVVGDADDPLPALGLVMLSYPLHAAGKPDQPRTAHFPGIRVPILFVSGTRDSMAGKDELTKAARSVKGKTSFHWVDTADHGYRPLKASGRTAADVLAEVADTTVAWVAGLAV
jgi:hypothetical protein